MAKDSTIIVIKLGTNILVDEEGTIQTERIENFAKQIKTLRETGMFPVLVVSGAIACGRGHIPPQGGAVPSEKRLLAGVGQAFLMSAFHAAFTQENLLIAQVLLVRENLLSQKQGLALMLRECRDWNITPIINEQDILEPGSFMGNDYLAAEIAKLLEAGTMVMLTNVDGLMDVERGGIPSLVQRIEAVTGDHFEKVIPVSSPDGVGGMKTKLDAAKELQEQGADVYIANGMLPDVLVKLLIQKEHIGTHIVAIK